MLLEPLWTTDHMEAVVEPSGSLSWVVWPVNKEGRTWQLGGAIGVWGSVQMQEPAEAAERSQEVC